MGDTGAPGRDVVAADAEETIPDDGATVGATGRVTGAADGALVTGGAGLGRVTATAGGGAGAAAADARGSCLVLGEGTPVVGAAIPAAESTAKVSPSAAMVVSADGSSGAGALGTTATCAVGSSAVGSDAAARARYCHTPSAATAITAAIPPTIANDGAEDVEALVPQKRHPPRERG